MVQQPHSLKIRNIIFDFGGVIINISHSKLEDAFRELGVRNFSELFNQAIQSDLFQQFEKGKVTPAEFRRSLKSISGLNVTDNELDEAWNQIIGDYPHERIDLLRRIKSNYRLFLLSNTNVIHFDYYIGKFSNEFGFEFRSLFDGTYWSFQRGKRKPDTEAFTDVLGSHGLEAGETLFIDDSKQNILAAREAGLKAFHLDNGMEIMDMFHDSVLKPSLNI